MNRIIAFLKPRECECCSANREYERLKARCEAIEADALGTIDFCIPSVKHLAGRREDYDDEDWSADVPTVQIFIRLEGEKTPVDSDLKAYAISELRRIAEELNVAADSLEVRP